MRPTYLVSLAALAFLATAAAVAAVAASAAADVIPKGFPYAAEIQVRVEYDGTYHRESETDIPCNDGENEVTLAGTETDDLHIERTVYFRHITVPVVKRGELGPAFGFLEVEPTVTTPGEFRDDRSTMDVKAAVLGDPATGCHTTEIPCHWNVQAAPRSGLQMFEWRGGGFLPISWDISILGTNFFTEEGCATGTGGAEELDTMLHRAGTLYTTLDLGNFPEVAIDRNQLGDFRELVHRRQVSFVQRLPSGLNTLCAGEEGTKTCTQGVSGRAKIFIKRLFLYRTKKEYKIPVAH